MAEVITAIYEKGVLKPLQQISFRNHQKVKIILEPNISWYREFKSLLEKIHNRTTKFNSMKIEKDITAAYRQARKIKNAYKSPH